MDLTPFDVNTWLAESLVHGAYPHMHHHNYCKEGLLVNLFNGPTPADRSDFHINTAAEFFFQFKGDMYARTLENGMFRDHTVAEGQMFCIRPCVPHRNRRPPGSLGLVVHGPRAPHALDSILWYCEKCCHQIHRVDYEFSDLRTQVPRQIEDFLSDDLLRTCRVCGEVMPADRGRMDVQGPSPDYWCVTQRDE